MTKANVSRAIKDAGKGHSQTVSPVQETFGVSNDTKGKDSDDGKEGVTRFDEVGEDFRGVSGFNESRQGARSSVDAGETDRKNGNADRNIDEV